MFTLKSHLSDWTDKSLKVERPPNCPFDKRANRSNLSFINGFQEPPSETVFMLARTSVATAQPVFPGWRATKGMKEAQGNLENTILQAGRWEVAGMPVSPAAHLLSVRPQLWLLCLPGGCGTTGSSRSPRQRGAKGKKVLCEIPTKWNMEKRIPFLKYPTTVKPTLVTWGKGHVQMVLLVYPMALCKAHTPSALMGDFFFSLLQYWNGPVLTEVAVFLGKQRRAGLPWSAWGEGRWGKRLSVKHSLTASLHLIP